MNPLLKAGEIDYFFTDSGAKIAFVWPDFVPEATKGAQNSGTQIIECGPMGPVAGSFEGGDPITDPHERADDDTAIILYTSGTTGRPKGAELTHSNIHLNALRSAKVIQQMTADDIVMGCLPLFHVFGLVVGLNAATIAGASLALIPRFDPAAAIEVIEKERVTIMQGVPTMYAAILNHPASDGMDASSLRTCASGGSAMPLEVMRSFEEKFGCYERLDTVRRFAATLSNLWLVGRNGMHRYNNQDHSMVSARMAVQCILDPSRDREAIWQVNLEQDYHEEDAAGGGDAARRDSGNP